MLQWFKDKYLVIKSDALKKGYVRVFKELLLEFIYKRKFKKLGVSNPPNNIALADTNAKSVNKDSNENQPTCFYTIRKVFKKIPLEPGEINLLDIGCGSGRLLCYGMYRRFNSVMGIDLDEKAIDKVNQNCKVLDAQGFATKYDISIKDATTIKIQNETNVIYLFNPFGEKTMTAVLDNIISQHKAGARPLYIAYVNPVHEIVFNGRNDCRKVAESFLKNGMKEMVIFEL